LTSGLRVETLHRRGTHPRRLRRRTQISRRSARRRCSGCSGTTSRHTSDRRVVRDMSGPGMKEKSERVAEPMAVVVPKPSTLTSPRVTFDKLTAMLVERNRSEALGRFKEDGHERYTYLWYGGPTTFFRRLDLKLSDATLEGWRGIFDSLLEQAYGSTRLESGV